MVSSSDIAKRITIDKSKLGVGLIGVSYSGEIPAGRKIKIRIISKDGAPDYRYNVQRHDTVWYPLQYGNGQYHIGILLEIEQNSSKYINTVSGIVDVNMPDPSAVFLQSNVNMNWRQDMKCIRYAKSITSGMTNDRAKTEAIWKYMYTNYKYDYQLASSVKYNYIPDIEDIFQTKDDICFGLTALFNSMLRSIGVKAKMLHGTPKNGIYHAWSEVFIGDRWVTVDITYDIALYQAGRPPVNFERDGNEYSVKYFY